MSELYSGLLLNDSKYGFSFTHHMQSFIVPELDPQVYPPALHVAARACKPFRSQGQGHELGTTRDTTTDHRGPDARGPEPMTTGAKGHRAKARILSGNEPRGQGQKAGHAGTSTRNHGGQAPKVPRTILQIRQPRERYALAQKMVDD